VPLRVAAEEVSGVLGFLSDFFPGMRVSGLRENTGLSLVSFLFLPQAERLDRFVRQPREVPIFIWRPPFAFFVRGAMVSSPQYPK